MRINGTKLDNRQENFIKDLMGDALMPDTRAEALLTKLCAKYRVDASQLIVAGAADQAAKPADPS